MDVQNPVRMLSKLFQHSISSRSENEIVALLWKPFYDLHGLFTLIISVSNPLLFCIARAARRSLPLGPRWHCSSSRASWASRAAACVLMPCQESRRLNDDPRFTAHEPKWCLSDSIKGLIPSKERLIIAVGSLSGGTTLKRSQCDHIASGDAPVNSSASSPGYISRCISDFCYKVLQVTLNLRGLQKIFTLYYKSSHLCIFSLRKVKFLCRLLNKQSTA